MKKASKSDNRVGSDKLHIMTGYSYNSQVTKYLDSNIKYLVPLSIENEK